MATTPEYPAELTITVTQNNIVNGKAQSTQYCPIAQAIREIYPQLHAAGVMVDGTDFYLSWFTEYGDVADSANYTLPRSARQFIDSFDAGLQVEPFTFVATRAPLREY